MVVNNLISTIIILTVIAIWALFLILYLRPPRQSVLFEDTVQTRFRQLSAASSLNSSQKHIVGLILLFLGCSTIYGVISSNLLTVLRFWGDALGVCVVLLATLTYCAVFLSKVILVLASIGRRTSNITYQVKDNELPIYTILVPLYKEAAIVPQLIQNLCKLDYPSQKLEVLLLYERGDFDTKTAIHDCLAAYQDHKNRNQWQAVEVPAPIDHIKTKPRAINYGLSKARGKYCVIYDAEDEPEHQQLRQAVAKFQELQDPAVICLQARIFYSNQSYNWITRLFASEYAQQHLFVISGLERLCQIIPLCGSSYHCITEELRQIGLDAYNVAEDCDLGVKISRAGKRVLALDSFTLEKADPNVWAWIKQRSRWIKGYLQTYLVHMRNPWKLYRELGIWKFIGFQVIVGGATFASFVSPFFWFLLIIFCLRTVLPSIELDYTLVPDSVINQLNREIISKPLLITTTLGNIFFVLSYVIAPCFLPKELKKANSTPRLASQEMTINKLHFGLRLLKMLISLALWLPGVFFYWVLLSIAAYKALLQLIIKPHYWEKSDHNYAVTKSG